MNNTGGCLLKREALTSDSPQNCKNCTKTVYLYANKNMLNSSLERVYWIVYVVFANIVITTTYIASIIEYLIILNHIPLYHLQKAIGYYLCFLILTLIIFAKMKKI